MHEVCPTQDTSRMGTARVKQEEEADTRIAARNLQEMNVGTKKRNLKEGLNSAKVLTIMLPEVHDSPSWIKLT